MRDPAPGQLKGGDKANFETLKTAFVDGNLALMSAVRKSDGAHVGLVVAMGHVDGVYYPTPLAVMIEGNPYEDFYDPTVTAEDVI